MFCSFVYVCLGSLGGRTGNVFFASPTYHGMFCMVGRERIEDFLDGMDGFIQDGLR